MRSVIVAGLISTCVGGCVGTPAAAGSQPAAGGSEPAAIEGPPAPEGPSREARADVPRRINERWLQTGGEEAAETLESEDREVFAARHEIVAALGLKPGRAVADVGAGSGLFTRLFAEAVGPSGTVYAVDIADTLLDFIAARAKEAGHANVRTVLGTAQGTGLPPDAVDLVFMSDTYHHFEYPQAMLRSIRSALRDGGELAIIDFERIEGESPAWILDHVRAGQTEVTREIKAAGFRRVREVELAALEQNYFVIFEKTGP